MIQVSNVCISREKHELCTQDRQGDFSRKVNVPSDMFNGEVYFPRFTGVNNKKFHKQNDDVYFPSFTRSKNEKFQEICHKKTFQKGSENRVMTQEWHEFRLRFCLQGSLQRRNSS